MIHDLFLTNIHIGKVRHLENFDIMLSGHERKHLILTGKNGSGKTSLLDAMKDIVTRQTQNSVVAGKVDPLRRTADYPGLYDVAVVEHDLELSYNNPDAHVHEFIFVHIPAERQKITKPVAIAPVEIKGKTSIVTNAGSEFLKYILSLDYRLYGAKADGNIKLVESLEKWFTDFQARLREIYDCQKLTLQRDTKNLAFQIVLPGYEPFGLNQMADGYYALLNIVMELLLRMDDDNSVVNYEKSGIVFVDEIETHLHVKLQKKVLPFLTGLFPNIQFIVTTHSPFVISSLSNAVVFDLEKKDFLEEPSRYSYETIVEAYFDTDMYSDKIKAVFKRYQELYSKERTTVENEEFFKVKTDLELVPPASKELYFAFREMENKRKAASNNGNR